MASLIQATISILLYIFVSLFVEASCYPLEAIAPERQTWKKQELHEQKEIKM